jgi:hypothetical protein
MNQSVNLFSKEAIRARMMQHAAQLWGVKSPQMLDPFVKLLMEAFSTEIFKVSNEVSNLQSRMLQKLARLLTPTMYTIPQPAHAIAVVHPVENGVVLHSNTEFFHKKLFYTSVKTASDVQIDMPFTPVDHTPLVRARVAAILTGDACFSVDGQGNRQLLHRIAAGKMPTPTIWLGIAVDEAFEEHWQRLGLYCSCPDYEHLPWLYELLSYANCSVAGHPLRIQKGLPYADTPGAGGYREIFAEYATFRRLQEMVKGVYANRFVTLDGWPMLVQQYAEKWPGEATELLEGHRPWGERTFIWLRLELPPQYEPAILNSMSFMLNAFPVINRRWKRNECQFDLAGNNIPLSTATGEHFLVVDEVADGKGRQYEEIPYSHATALEKGLYTVRVAGMERFDERSAIDMIDYVLELTRDEVTAFANLERDNVVAALQEMISRMKFLERKTQTVGKRARQVPSYVMVAPHSEKEYMYASYWVTHCALANNLRPGLVLTGLRSPQIQKGALTLLTTTTGGREAQTGMDAIQAYRYALSTRDRIITIEDIRNYCRMELGEAAREITIRKGTEISQKPKEGFIRVLVITIAVPDDETYQPAYWQSRARALQQQIELRSADGVEYRVTFVPVSDTAHQQPAYAN